MALLEDQVAERDAQLVAVRRERQRADELLKERDSHVPFVNRPFESEIHGTVNFTYFCCFLLVTSCHRVLLSCYLRPK